MLLTLKTRYLVQLLAVVVLIGASPADAQNPALNSQVRAQEQGIALAISNNTTYNLTAVGSTDADVNVNGPGFPTFLLPYQHSGTGVFLRGGPASEGLVEQAYYLEQQDTYFSLFFQAETDWDLKAAASDVLHAVKSKVSSEAKDSLKDDAKKGGDDALKAAGAEDGMTEVIETMKVIEAIADLYKALDPEYVMVFGWQPQSGYPFYTDESCISENVSTPAPANVVIVGPDQLLTAESAGDFFVLSALSVNGENPGFVDASVTPMCDYACAAFNASNDWLNGYTQSQCIGQLGTTTQETQAAEVYSGYDTLNVCIRTAADGPAGVSWVTPPTNTIERWYPDGSSCVQGEVTYPPITDSICGTCPPPPPPAPSGAPSGSWQESCEQTSWEAPTLCANCEQIGSPNSVSSCATCSSEEFTNVDGTLTCANSAAASSEQTLTFPDLSPRSPFFEQLATVQLPDLSKPFFGERR
jgi:hypothetical protein